MSTWNSTITNKGIALQNKMVEGATLSFTRVVSGTGVIVPVNLKQQTAVTGIEQTLSVTNLSVNDENSNYTARIMLNNVGLTTGYNLSQVGFYATDPDDGEVLFAIAQLETVKPIPTASDSPGYTIEFAFTFQNSQSATIDFDIDAAAYLTRGTLDTVLVDYYDKDEVDDLLGALNPNNLTGPVSIAKGGTGKSTAPLAVEALMGTGRKSISLQLQPIDQAKFIVGLFKITSGNNDYCFSRGSISFQRANGLNGNTVTCNYAFSKLYSTTECSGAYQLIGGNTPFIFKPCTFTYNGNLYFGFDIFSADASYTNMQLDCFTSSVFADIFCIPYYKTNDNTVINAEINSSISYSTVTMNDDLIFNNKSLLVSDSKTVYVNSSTGNDDTGYGTSNRPFATIQKAIYSIPKNLGGNTVTIRIAGGTYTERLNISGYVSGSLHLTFDSATTIIGTLTVTNQSYVVINGTLTIDSSAISSANTIYVTNNACLNKQSSDITLIGSSNNNSLGVQTLHGGLFTGNLSSGSITCNNCGYALSSGTEGSIYNHLLKGSGNTVACIARGGAIRLGSAPASTVANTLYQTERGGRIYTGAQNSVPNY